MDSSIKPVLFILLIILSLYLNPSKIPCINSFLSLNPTQILFQFFPSSQPNPDLCFNSSLPLNPTLILFQLFHSSQPNSGPVSIFPFLILLQFFPSSQPNPDPILILLLLSTQPRSYLNSSITLNPT